MAWQPEDLLVVELLAALRGQILPHSEWVKHATPESTKNVGSSANWYMLAAAVGLHMRNIGAFVALDGVLSEPNDHCQGEAQTDDGHAVLWLCGAMAARYFAQTSGKTLIADKLDQHIKQWWAQQFLCASDPENPLQNVFVPSGQRWVAPKVGRWKVEYLWCRGNGYEIPTLEGIEGFGKRSDGTFIGDRIQKDQGPFSLEAFLGEKTMLRDLRLDCSEIRDAYRRAKWDGVGDYLKFGTRGTMHWIRFKNGGYAHVLEEKFGIPPTRFVTYKAAPESNVKHVPSTPLPRSSDGKGYGVVDFAAKTITGHSEDRNETKTYPFPAEIEFYAKTSKNGVEFPLRQEAQLPPSVFVPGEAGPVTVVQPKRRSFLQRIADFFRGLF